MTTIDAFYTWLVMNHYAEQIDQIDVLCDHVKSWKLNNIYGMLNEVGALQIRGLAFVVDFIKRERKIVIEPM